MKRATLYILISLSEYVNKNAKHALQNENQFECIQTLGVWEWETVLDGKCELTLARVRPVLVRDQKTSGLQRFHTQKVLSRSLTRWTVGEGGRQSTRGLKLCVSGFVWSPSLALCHTHKQWENYQGFLFRHKTSQQVCTQNPYLKAGDSLEETSSTTGLLVKNQFAFPIVQFLSLRELRKEKKKEKKKKVNNQSQARNLNGGKMLTLKA